MIHVIRIYLVVLYFFSFCIEGVLLKSLGPRGRCLRCIKFKQMDGIVVCIKLS